MQMRLECDSTRGVERHGLASESTTWDIPWMNAPFCECLKNTPSPEPILLQTLLITSIFSERVSGPFDHNPMWILAPFPSLWYNLSHTSFLKKKKVQTVMQWLIMIGEKTVFSLFNSLGCSFSLECFPPVRTHWYVFLRILPFALHIGNNFSRNLGAKSASCSQVLSPLLPGHLE
jgi:hypothetical protein